MKIGISACLLGYNCKYNGLNNFNSKVYNLNNHFELVPICPEVFGDLDTPRTCSERIGDKVITKEGIDVSNNFIKGALLSLKILQKNNINIAILKANSPSCGYKYIYDGTFSSKLIAGNGVTCDLFIKNNIKVYTENDDFNF